MSNSVTHFVSLAQSQQDMPRKKGKYGKQELNIKSLPFCHLSNILRKPYGEFIYPKKLYFFKLLPMFINDDDANVCEKNRNTKILTFNSGRTVMFSLRCNQCFFSSIHSGDPLTLKKYRCVNKKFKQLFSHNFHRCNTKFSPHLCQYFNGLYQYLTETS